MKPRPQLISAVAAFAVAASIPNLVAAEKAGQTQPPAALGAVPAPQPDPTGIDKVKFISLIPPSGAVYALRVNLTSLHHVDPPYSAAPSVPFTAFEGLSVWVGPPATFVESAQQGTTFNASLTSCQPNFQDWSTVGLLHITGNAIVPSSIYHVEAVDTACQGVESSPDCQSGGVHASSQLEIRTERFGDVEAPFGSSSTTRQPNASDMAAVLKKYHDVPGSIIKVRAFNEVYGANLNFIGLSELATELNAFHGLGYFGGMTRCGECADYEDCVP